MKMFNSKLLIVFSLSTFTCLSQVKEKEFTNEVRLNTLYVPVGAVEVDYEILLNSNRGFGSSVLIPITEPNREDFDFMLTPYYRWYKGKVLNNGFFIETFTQFAKKGSKYSLALGPAIGGKFLFNQSYNAELNFGLGAFVYDNIRFSGYLPLTPRVGVKLGKRF